MSIQTYPQLTSNYNPININYYNDPKGNTGQINEASEDCYNWVETLIELAGKSKLTNIEIIISLCASIQAVCRWEDDRKQHRKAQNNVGGINLYKAVLDTLFTKNKNGYFFDFFANNAEFSKVMLYGGELTDNIKHTGLCRGGTIFGYLGCNGSMFPTRKDNVIVGKPFNQLGVDDKLENNCFEWVDELAESINNADLDHTQLVFSLCASTQAICLIQDDLNQHITGLDLYKAATEILKYNSDRMSFYDFYDAIIKSNVAEIERCKLAGERLTPKNTPINEFFDCN